MKRFATLTVAVLVAGLFARADWPEERAGLERAFESGTPAQRAEAVRGLKEFDHAEGVRLLLERWLGEREPEVRRALADKIALVNDARGREVIRETVTGTADPEARARWCGLFAGGRIPGRADLLRELMADPEPVVRARVLRVLGGADAEMLEDAAKLLADGVVDVRMAACGALAAMGSKLAVPELVAALEREGNREVRWAAGDALRRVTGQDFGGDVAAWKGWWREWQEKVGGATDPALKRAAAFLKPLVAAAMKLPGAQEPPRDPMLGWEADASQGIELGLFALIHAGVPADDPVMQAGIEHLLTAPLQENYNVSIMAMALADLDAVGHRARLAEIAQWLVDRQCANGQWTYTAMLGLPPADARSPRREAPPVDTPSGQAGAASPPPPIRIEWRDRRRAPAGDNSNTQFSLLGLRATLAAGCEIPKIVWQRSLRWFESRQRPDGGWEYDMDGSHFNSYGAMTLTGLASVAICRHALGDDDRLQPGRLGTLPSIRKGLDWVERKWTVEKHPGMQGIWLYYYIYSIERAGMILGLERFGTHDWYAEGSKFLLAHQREDGGWMAENRIWDTSFAILFLKRATHGYTTSGPGKGK